LGQHQNEEFNVVPAAVQQAKSQLNFQDWKGSNLYQADYRVQLRWPRIACRRRFGLILADMMNAASPATISAIRP